VLQPVVATIIQQQSSVTFSSLGESVISDVEQAVVATSIQQQSADAADFSVLPDGFAFAAASLVEQPVVASMIQQQSLAWFPIVFGFCWFFPTLLFRLFGYRLPF